jgi:cytochrome oxidase Cu insertion factor (SCO1/SenC/PrrC family)
MKRSVLALVPLTALLLIPLAGHSRPAAQEESASTMAKTTLKVGDVAPDFTLPSDQNRLVKLSDYRGKKNVILAFYVLAFTGG